MSRSTILRFTQVLGHQILKCSGVLAVRGAGRPDETSRSSALEMRFYVQCVWRDGSAAHGAAGVNDNVHSQHMYREELRDSVGLMRYDRRNNNETQLLSHRWPGLIQYNGDAEAADPPTQRKCSTSNPICQQRRRAQNFGVVASNGVFRRTQTAAAVKMPLRAVRVRARARAQTRRSAQSASDAL